MRSGRPSRYRHEPMGILMFDAVSTQSARWFRTKTVVFALIGAMTIYVLYHNERFLIDPAHPVWQHYEPFKWWLLLHGVVGGFAFVLAPLQFSDRLRRRFARLHRVTGRIYVASVFVLSPLGILIAYVSEAQGEGSTSLIYAGWAHGGLLMIATGIGLMFAMRRNIPQHRQWMTRSYALALVFIEVRVFLGVTGFDQPPNPQVPRLSSG